MRRLISLLLLAVALSGDSLAQLPEFNMADTTVTDCDGLLFDSGGPGEIYLINEDLTFTINTGGPITLNFFGPFCVETNLDFLLIYDGPNIISPLIAGPLTGNLLPSTIIANSGAVTIQFISDGSVAYCGFGLQWETSAPPPLPPTISTPGLPACGIAAFQVQFSNPIPCSAISEADVTLSAQYQIGVVNFSPISCQNGMASTALLTMNQPFETNCLYNLEVELGLLDICDSLWLFELEHDFVYDNCPPEIEVTAEYEVVCDGQCTSVEAFATGCFGYTYDWNMGLPNGPGPHTVCPAYTTTYSVIVTESVTGLESTASVTVQVLNPQIQGGNIQLCQSEPDFFLQATPPGGIWEGAGVVDGVTGLFNADLAAPGENIISYYIEEFDCGNTIIIDMDPIEAGIVTAACPGTDPFQLNAFPLGGTWSGNFVSAGGMFNPQEEGSFYPVYAVNGCTDTIEVNVGVIDVLFTLPDTICQSELPDTLFIEPFGGIWSGPGIADPLYGVFNPEWATPGNITLLYDMQGCDIQFETFIKEINIGPKWQNACPEEGPFMLYDAFAPTGGIWEGPGITDNINGVFDPAIPGNDTWNTLLYHAPNGCTDTIFMYVRQTEILSETIYFCEGADPFVPLIWETIYNTPWGGIWTGPGVYNPAEEPWNYGFDPIAAGIGDHELAYEINGCADTIHMIVHPQLIIPIQNLFCTSDSALELAPGLPPGITWSGQGILNPLLSIFDPLIAGPGNFTISWSSPAGCAGSFQVVVEQFYQADISGLEEIYCWINSDIPIILEPEDGVLSGISGTEFFNPAQEGAAIHQLLYEWSTDACASSDSITILVYPELLVSLNASDTLLCEGEGSVVTASAGGGLPGILYTYQWNEGLFPIASQTAAPDETTTYIVTITDGCSDAAVDSVSIAIVPPIMVEVTTSDTLCFGEDGGFANAVVLNEGIYEISWEGMNGSTIEAPAGSVFELLLTDVTEGCTFDSLIVIPSFNPVSALFSVNPSMDCIPETLNPIEIIDLSENAISGFWIISGDTLPYQIGMSPSFNLTPAEYAIQLSVQNEGGCESSFSTEICVMSSTPVFVPDIFSPNGDGNNDMLYVRSPSLLSLHFEVYNRWGEKVFETNDINHGWDGQHRGNPSPGGVYVYRLKARKNDGEELELKGDITLVR
jgi:gliding motility-associated-like protein